MSSGERERANGAKQKMLGGEKLSTESDTQKGKRIERMGEAREKPLPSIESCAAWQGVKMIHGERS